MYADVKTTMVYTHVLNRFQEAVASENGRIIRADRSVQDWDERC